MPDTGAPWNLPYPAIGDQADVPGDVGALAAAVEAALDAVDAKTVPGTIISDAAAFTSLTGWSVSSAQLLRLGRLNYFYIAANRTGAAISVGASGDITNSGVAQLVPSPNPLTQFPCSSVGAGRVAVGAIGATGGVSVTAVGGGGVSIATGDVITLAGFFIA